MNKKPTIYKIGAAILGPIFKWYYTPIIIGKDNIPKEGSCILAGDHIHLYDQCHAIVSTNRTLVYMAKKEYFDNKKTEWFFRGVGCIPVDRSKKDEHAVESALSALKSGEILGIFPEGTRNALKEERVKEIYDKYFTDIDYETFSSKLNAGKPKLSQIRYLLGLYDKKKIKKQELDMYIYNADEALKELWKNNVIKEHDYYDSLLLDFKFGAVSMAQKTNSPILPMVVTGDYKFKSKNLVVRFGSLYEVGKKDLAKANAELREIFIQMLKENYEMTK
jgi:1-acyl-sn-glycerol-3-phosphate acyltransferase